MELSEHNGNSPGKRLERRLHGVKKGSERKGTSKRRISKKRWKGASVTLNMLFDRYMATKFGLKESSYASYMQMYNNHVREHLGNHLVCKLRYSDVMAFYTYMLKTKKVSIRTMEYVNKQIYPALELAVQDGLIVKNPAKGAFGVFKKKKR